MALKKTELINFLITDKDIGISKFQPPSPCLEKSQTLIEVAPYQEHYSWISFKFLDMASVRYTVKNKQCHSYDPKMINMKIMYTMNN